MPPPVTLPTEKTLLILNGIGVPLYSSRGLTQTLSLIDAAKQIRRTINMELVDISMPGSKKYQSEISCSDFAPPAFDSVFPGTLVTVDCVVELSYPVGGTPGRTVVPGSDVTEGNFIRYRPRLSMMVVDLEIEEPEWTAGVSWVLRLMER